MNEILERKFITCLEELEKGQSLEDVLALYPEDNERLRPLLETAATLATLPVQPTLAAQLQSKKAFLQEAAALKSSPASRRWYFSLPRVLQPVLGVGLILLLFTAGLFAAADNAVPGDLLYQTKLGYENIRLNLAGTAAKEGLKEQYAQERLQEVRRLLVDGDEAIVIFSGEITAISTDQVRIVDIYVQLVPDVKIIGELVIGRMATITGRTANGVLEAIMIEVDEEATKRDGPADEPADEVEPSATMTPSSTVTLSPEITETTEPRETVGPSPTATPTVTATTVPTATGSPTAIPDDSDEDEGENDNDADEDDEDGTSGESEEDDEQNDNDNDNESDDNDNGSDDNDNDSDDNDNDSDDNDNGSDDNDNDSDDNDNDSDDNDDDSNDNDSGDNDNDNDSSDNDDDN